MTIRPAINGMKPSLEWVDREKGRLKNLEREYIDILNDRDNKTLELNMRIRELEKENRSLTAKTKKQKKRIDWLEERYIYGGKA